MNCPNCNKTLPDGAVLCTGCGCNFKTGRVMTTDTTPRSSLASTPEGAGGWTPPGAGIGTGTVWGCLGLVLLLVTLGGYLVYQAAVASTDGLSQELYRIGPNPTVTLRRRHLKKFADNLSRDWTSIQALLDAGEYVRAKQSYTEWRKLLQRILHKHANRAFSWRQTWQEWADQQDEAFAAALMLEYKRLAEQLETGRQLETSTFLGFVRQFDQWVGDSYAADQERLGKTRAKLAAGWLRVLLPHDRNQLLNGVLHEAVTARYGQGQSHTLVFCQPLTDEEAAATWKTLVVGARQISVGYSNIEAGLLVVAGYDLWFSMNGTPKVATTWDTLPRLSHKFSTPAQVTRSSAKTISHDNIDALRQYVRGEIARFPPFAIR